VLFTYLHLLLCFGSAASARGWWVTGADDRMREGRIGETLGDHKRAMVRERVGKPSSQLQADGHFMDGWACTHVFIAVINKKIKRREYDRMKWTGDAKPAAVCVMWGLDFLKAWAREQGSSVLGIQGIGMQQQANRQGMGFGSMPSELARPRPKYAAAAAVEATATPTSSAHWSAQRGGRWPAGSRSIVVEVEAVVWWGTPARTAPGRGRLAGRSKFEFDVASMAHGWSWLAGAPGLVLDRSWLVASHCKSATALHCMRSSRSSLTTCATRGRPGRSTCTVLTADAGQHGWGPRVSLCLQCSAGRVQSSMTLVRTLPAAACVVYLF